jgi:hypothetical protein
MIDATQHLFSAEQKAKELFKTIEDRGLIVAGKSEKQLSDEIVRIAKADFAVEHHWEKKL